MNTVGRIVYCNTIGMHSILVTKIDVTRPTLNHSIPSNVIYGTHVWIHNNKVLKCRIESELFYTGAQISDTKLSHLFGVDLIQIMREEKIKNILS